MLPIRNESLLLYVKESHLTLLEHVNNGLHVYKFCFSRMLTPPPIPRKSALALKSIIFSH